MSFFLTLPSNSSMDLYPSNTISEFTVQLKEPIRLDEAFEVALVEFTYKHSWSISVGKLVIDLKNDNNYDVFDLIIHDGESLISFTHRLNGEVLNYYLKKEYERRYSLSIKALNNNTPLDTKILLPLSSYNSDSRDQSVISEIKNSIEYKNIPTFSFDINKFYIFIPDKAVIKLEGRIIQILKLENKWYFGSMGKRFTESEIIDDPNPNLIQSFFVYCDIINFQYVGDAIAPLLRNVVVGNSYLKIGWIHYDNPHYVTVSRSEISSIKIEIRDDTGEKIKFDDGKIILKLHFRPKK